MMRILITFLLLIITIISLFVFKSFAKRNSATWIVAVLGLLLTFVSVWFWRASLPVNIDLFLRSDLIPLLPKLSITPTNWVFSLILLGATITILLALPSRGLPQGHFYYWIATPLTLIFALLSVNAGNLTLIILSLGAMDLLETISLIRSGHFAKARANYPLINLTMQTFGLFLIIFAAIHTEINLNDLAGTTLTDTNSILLALGFFFRSKIFQVSIDRASEPEEDQAHHWLSLLNLIKMSSLIFMISLLPHLTISTGWTISLESIFLIFGIYFSWLWVTSQGTLFSAHYLLISGSMLGLYNAMVGAPQSTAPMAMLTLFIGGMLNQHTQRTRARSIYLFALSLFALALPYTFTATIWQLPHTKNFLTLPFVILTYLLILVGYVRHVFEDIDPEKRSPDGWSRVISPFTLGLLPITIALFGLLWWDGAASIGFAIVYIPKLVLYALVLVLVFRFRQGLQILINVRIPFIGNVLTIVSKILGRGTLALFELTKWLNSIITALLEGEGALLWTILILLILLLVTRGGS